MKKVVLSMAALSMLFFVACQGPKKEIARLQFQNDSIAQVNTRLASARKTSKEPQLQHCQLEENR